MKQQIQKYGPRYGFAAGVGSFATYLASTVPVLRDMPMEVSVPLVLAVVRFITEVARKYFKLPQSD